jgi:sugar lactone lactonase YvrE
MGRRVLTFALGLALGGSVMPRGASVGVSAAPSSVVSEGGHFRLFTIPTAHSYPSDITAGPDGNMWFTDDFGGKIGRITPAGAITEFPVPHSPRLEGIAAGPDGNLWFTDLRNDRIGRISTAGVITEFPLRPNAEPMGITAGPDGNLWFTEFAADRIGRITPAGVITEFRVPGFGVLWDITAGPDGNLWFTDFHSTWSAGSPPGAPSPSSPSPPGRRLKPSPPVRTGTCGSSSTGWSRGSGGSPPPGPSPGFPSPLGRAFGHHRGAGREPVVHGDGRVQDRADHRWRSGEGIGFEVDGSLRDHHGARWQPVVHGRR